MTELALGLLFSLFAKILLLFCGGILVLGDKVVRAALSLGEAHLVCALIHVPVQDGLLVEHGSKLLLDVLEQLLDGQAVANDGDCHFQATGRDIADSCLDIIGDPFHKVAAIPIFHVEICSSTSFTDICPWKTAAMASFPPCQGS